MFNKEQIAVLQKAFGLFPKPENDGYGFIRLAVLILRDREGKDSPYFRLIDSLFGVAWREGKKLIFNALTDWACNYLETMEVSTMIFDELAELLTKEGEGLAEIGGLQGVLAMTHDEVREKFEKETAINMSYCCEQCKYEVKCIGYLNA